MRPPGGKSNGESPFFETPNLSFEGRVRNVAVMPIAFVIRYFPTRCRRLSFQPLKSQELKHRRLVCRSYWAFEHSGLNFVEASVRVPSVSDLSSRRAR